MPDSSPDRLPFEPRKKRPKPTTEKTQGKTSEVKAAAKPETKPTSKPASTKDSQEKKQPVPLKSQDLAIPRVVSDRMIKRMVILAGVPVLLGVMTFLGSYYIVVNDLFELPNTAVLLVSMGWFGLGVLGLSYGVISASWEEEIAGSLSGLREFTINFQRLVGAWQEARQKNLK